MWLSVIEQLISEKEPASQSTRQICSGSDKGFSDSGPLSVGKIIHRSHGILLHEGALSSDFTGRRRNGKGLEAPFIIMDPQKACHLFFIMLFPPATN